MKKTLSFTEVCGNAKIEMFASSLLQKMIFPIEGRLSLGEEGRNSYGHKGACYCGDKNLLDLETSISWITSRKNEKFDNTFYLAQTLNIQLLIFVHSKNEKEDFSITIHELSENHFPLDILITPLLVLGEEVSEITFNLLDIEDFPEEPVASYDVHIFNQQVLKGSLLVSKDGKVMFHQTEDGECVRIWSNQLPKSINRFLGNRSLKGVLSQTVVANKMVSLLENGLVYNGTGNITKTNVSRETYEYLVYLAETQYKGENIHTELTPCLFSW